jgi:hypothetical protein
MNDRTPPQAPEKAAHAAFADGPTDLLGNPAMPECFVECGKYDCFAWGCAKTRVIYVAPERDPA